MCIFKVSFLPTQWIGKNYRCIFELLLRLKDKVNLTKLVTIVKKQTQSNPESVHNLYSCEVKRFFFLLSLDAANYHNSARDNQFPAHHTAHFPARPGP